MSHTKTTKHLFSKIPSVIILSGLVFVVFAAITLLRVHAVSAGADCQEVTDSITYDSTVTLANGSYKIYMKLASPEPISLAVELKEFMHTTEHCMGIGPLTSTMTPDWQYVGEVTLDSAGDGVWLNTVKVYGEEIDTLLPRLLYVPISANTPCLNPNDCRVTYRDAEYFLMPKKLSLNSDGLSVAMYFPLSDNTAPTRSILYEDGKVVRITKGRIEFDQTLIFPGNHTITRDVLLTDGQTLSHSEEIYVQYDVINPIRAIYARYGTLLRTVAVSTAFVFLYITAYIFVRKIVIHKQWVSRHLAKTSENVEIPDDDPLKRYQSLMKKERQKNDIKSIIKLGFVPFVVIASLVAIDSFILSTFRVEGISMETTLRDGSRVLLWKAPITLSRINGATYEPNRGDTVVVEVDENSPHDNVTKNAKTYVVKRVLGVPGDRILVDRGKITIFNDANPEGYDPDEAYWGSVIVPSRGRYVDITLKEGEIFVAGDNREHSIDSRTYGSIRSVQIVGLALYNKSSDRQPYDATK